MGIKQFIIISLILLVSSCSTVKNASEENENKQKQTKLAEINVQLGMAYLEQNNTLRAKQKLLSAIDEAPNLPEVWYAFAYYQEMTGKKALANQYYLKSVQLAPDRGDIQNNYGTYLCRLGQYQDAIQHFQLAVQDVNYLDMGSAYENAGLCALKIPNTSMAKKYFKLALSTDPNRDVSIKELAKLAKLA